MRLRQCVRERRREQDQLAGSSLDSQKKGDKIHQDLEDGALSTFGGKVSLWHHHVKGTSGLQRETWRTWTPALGKSPDFRNTIVTRDMDFTAL